MQQALPTKNYPFVVGVCDGAAPGMCRHVCSGILLESNLVLTSRHCVQEAPLVDFDCLSARYGAPRPGPFWVTLNEVMSGASNWLRVERIIATPGDVVCGHDLAMLVLDGSVKRSATALVVPSTLALDREPLFDGSVVAVGFGETNPDDGAGLGTRRMRSDIKVRCVPGDPRFSCSDVDLAEIDPQRDFMTEGAMCTGDSGAGAYSSRSLEVPLAFGVLSRATLKDGRCTRGVYTRTAVWADFLAYGAWEAATRAGTTPPAWATELSDGKPRELGTRCYEARSCTSNICAAPSGSMDFVCSTSCSPRGNDCPEGYSCNAADNGSGFCFPRPGLARTSSCAAGTGPTMASASLGAAFVAVMVAIRRRRLKGSRS